MKLLAMKARFWRTTLALAATIVLMAGQLHAVEKKIRITGIYSDLTYNQEGGDLLGTELFIVNAQENGFFAFFQNWQGGTTPPVVVPVQVDGDRVTLRDPCTFIGRRKLRGARQRDWLRWKVPQPACQWWVSRRTGPSQAQEKLLAIGRLGARTIETNRRQCIPTCPASQPIIACLRVMPQ